MLKSEYNKGVLDNFVLWYTHKHRVEVKDSKEIESVFAQYLYTQVDRYIENDHVDGINGDNEGENVKFTNTDKYYYNNFASVYTTNGIEIARSVLGNQGYEVQILQGMDRASTVAKILRDCPEWAKENNLKSYSWPKLFTQTI